MKHIAITALAAFTLTGVAAPSFAEEPPRMRIELGRVDLTTEDGLKDAYNRVEEAARRYCTVEVTGTRIRTVDADCKATMMAAGIKVVDSLIGLKPGESRSAEVVPPLGSKKPA